MEIVQDGDDRLLLQGIQPSGLGYNHHYFLLKTTVVSDHINTMETTFDFNFDLFQAVKHPWKRINIEAKRTCQLKKLLFDYL